jgi:hypothetical protein
MRVNGFFERYRFEVKRDFHVMAVEDIQGVDDAPFASETNCPPKLSMVPGVDGVKIVFGAPAVLRARRMGRKSIGVFLCDAFDFAFEVEAISRMIKDRVGIYATGKKLVDFLRFYPVTIPEMAFVLGMSKSNLCKYLLVGGKTNDEEKMALEQGLIESMPAFERFHRLPADLQKKILDDAMANGQKISFAWLNGIEKNGIQPSFDFTIERLKPDIDKAVLDMVQSVENTRVIQWNGKSPKR